MTLMSDEDEEMETRGERRRKGEGSC